MLIVNEKNLLEAVGTYLIDNGCDPIKTRQYFNARRFLHGIVMPLPAVCLVPGNKPAESRSKQTHIHVTSKSREFFYSAKELEEAKASTPWIRQNLIIANNNIQALHGEELSTGLSMADSYMMTKIECRKSQEKQVQLSRLSKDDALFLKLRQGLYENDVLIFLKYRDSRQFFVVGIPYSYHFLKFEFESPRKTARFKGETYESLQSRNAIPVKTAVENVLAEHRSDEIIESEEPISDAVYQSMVDSAKASDTTYAAEKYVAQNPDGNSTTSHRPPTNPALGKEAIKDNSYCCSINAGHNTFLKPDGTRYMEVHHLIPLNQQKNFQYKLDTKANIVPLCPNCHRMLHYGCLKDIKETLKDLYDKRTAALKQSGLDVSFKDLISYYVVETTV